LPEKLQEVAAWHAYILQAQGEATSDYVLWSIVKRQNPRDEEIAEECGLAQALMKRLELHSEALERLYAGLSRQLSARDISSRIEGSRKYT